ncbi:uncharacterized protein LOC130372800 [Gadus chalcogrammus]|uniref:uncharacterized protein LOC130372800 n=1 Tax=Gadus chalcogrammus TaxID=1042646 RepID=UPI0024C47A50|nr:uncharacterized protein LOC130372800 [Gadus chalcogrammus]
MDLGVRRRQPIKRGVGHPCQATVEVMRAGEERATGITKSQPEKRVQPRDQSEKKTLSIDNQPQSIKNTKSAINDLFKEMQDRVSQGKGNTGRVIDFRKFLKRPDRPPPPPPAAPRRKASPPPPRLVKRKVEVDLLKLCWGESWKTLKPTKRGRCHQTSSLRSTISPGRRSRAGAARGGEEEASPGWTDSWKLVKPSPAPPGPTGVGEGQAWEVVTESRSLGRYQPRVGGYCLPVWATTWKTMIFVFRQQKPWWDREWPSRPPPEPQDKTPQLLALETQCERPDWQQAWRMSVTAPPADTEPPAGTTKMADVFLPGWNSAWRLAGAHPTSDEGAEPRNWNDLSWKLRPQSRWCMPSLTSQHHHASALEKSDWLPASF